MTRWRSRLAGTSLLVFTVLQATGGAQPLATEEFAQGQFRLALDFMRKGKYTEALADLQRIVDAYPNSSVADDAMLEIATYHLEVAREIEAAQATITLLLQKYPATEVTPSAYVMAARIGLMQGSAPEQIEAVLANLERASIVPRLDVTPIASFYAGRALQIGGRPAEAVDRLMRVVVEYPGSPWAARSLLGLARSHLSLGDPVRAMGALQRLRERFRGTREDQEALKWNTLLYRLYLKAPKTPPFSFSRPVFAGPSGKLEEVRALATTADQHVFVVSGERTLEFSLDGTIVKGLPGTEGRALVMMPNGVPAVLTKTSLVAAGGTATALTVNKADGSPRRLEDLRAAVATDQGTLLVADGNLRAIMRFRTDGKPLGEFATSQAARLAINDLGEVAALDRDAKIISRFDRSGRPLGRIPFTGPRFELRNPVDLAYDPIGHLYVLDRDQATVFVFGPRENLVATFTVADKTPGAFRRATALAVGDAGELFISDDRSERVQVYR